MVIMMIMVAMMTVFKVNLDFDETFALHHPGVPFHLNSKHIFASSPSSTTAPRVLTPTPKN
eukprot:1712387-Lingulodinium_polyedra.AAC.1